MADELALLMVGMVMGLMVGELARGLFWLLTRVSRRVRRLKRMGLWE